MELKEKQEIILFNIWLGHGLYFNDECNDIHVHCFDNIMKNIDFFSNEIFQDSDFKYYLFYDSDFFKNKCVAYLQQNIEDFDTYINNTFFFIKIDSEYIEVINLNNHDNKYNYTELYNCIMNYYDSEYAYIAFVADVLRLLTFIYLDNIKENNDTKYIYIYIDSDNTFYTDYSYDINNLFNVNNVDNRPFIWIPLNNNNCIMIGDRNMQLYKEHIINTVINNYKLLNIHRLTSLTIKINTDECVIFKYNKLLYIILELSGGQMFKQIPLVKNLLTENKFITPTASGYELSNYINNEKRLQHFINYMYSDEFVQRDISINDINKIQTEIIMIMKKYNQQLYQFMSNNMTDEKDDPICIMRMYKKIKTMDNNWREDIIKNYIYIYDNILGENVLPYKFKLKTIKN